MSIVTLYEKIWEEKQRRTNTYGQRHAPTVNKKGQKNRVHESTILIAAMHHVLLSITTEEAFDMHYFDKVLGIFADSKDGLLHCGELLSQHIIVIGACIGIYPLPLATMGEIGDTTCRDYIRAKYGLFNSSEDIPQESALWLLPL